MPAAPVAKGKLDEVASHAQKNAEIAESLATEFHGLANAYLGSEPPSDNPETGPDQEPCLCGSLMDNHQRTLRALEQLKASFERLRQAYILQV